MGDMADFALEGVVTMEGLRDDYVSGDMGMDEAYDNGFLDSLGRETSGVQEAWDRSVIGSARNLDAQLKDAESTLNTPYEKHSLNERTLNSKAILNLGKLTPTCNTCEQPMKPREGRYGKFYYCTCPAQPTVSAAYWQKVRVIK